MRPKQERFKSKYPPNSSLTTPQPGFLHDWILDQHHALKSLLHSFPLELSFHFFLIVVIVFFIIVILSFLLFQNCHHPSPTVLLITARQLMWKFRNKVLQMKDIFVVEAQVEFVHIDGDVPFFEAAVAGLKVKRYPTCKSRGGGRRSRNLCRIQCQTGKNF